MSRRAEAGRPRAERTTIYDVARIAGVSYGTVSRVLNGRLVGSASRKAVERALTSSGYAEPARASARRYAPRDGGFLHWL